jgi:hypothetical protein
VQLDRDLDATSPLHLTLLGGDTGSFKPRSVPLFPAGQRFAQRTVTAAKAPHRGQYP